MVGPAGTPSMAGVPRRNARGGRVRNVRYSPVSSAPVSTAAPGGASPPSRSAPSAVRAGYRPELQGLRAVAVLLVAVYHIWFGRVSGGVDVFLLLTGFLITGSLVRSAEREGRVGIIVFWTRLVRRIVPTAAVALAGILTATYLFLPQARWRDTLGEVVAAALYHENWHLALNSVDYLASNTAASPVQHFWSLSIQGQLYLVWPFLIAVAVWAAGRSGRDARRTVLVVLAAVFALSLAYSVVITRLEQQWAYFDTGARVWELALGGMAALFLPRLRMGRRLRVVLGWAGLFGLVACGALFQVSTMFPGYVALWPTLAAMLVLVAGDTGSRVGADRMMSWRPLRYLGDISYALYLWHWPVLVCYLTLTGQKTPGLVSGSAVLAVSLVLAAATQRLVDEGRDRMLRGGTTPMRSVVVGLAFLLPVLTAAGGWSGYLDHQQRHRSAIAADPGNYPGARMMTGEALETVPDVPVRPDPAEAAEDLPVTYTDECNQNTREAEVITCSYGANTPERTIALVGGSHAAHWFPALKRIANENGWRVVNIVKGACLFTELRQTYDGEAYTSCAEWNDGVVDELEELRPDAVFTTATSSSIDPEAGFGGEVVVEGYLDRWREMDELGIEVVAVRDTPRAGFDTAECVARARPAECAGQRWESLERTSPLAGISGLPGNVSLLDLNDYLCSGSECPAVVGNVLVYWDGNHITRTYMRTLAPVLEREMTEATGW